MDRLPDDPDDLGLFPESPPREKNIEVFPETGVNHPDHPAGEQLPLSSYLKTNIITARSSQTTTSSTRLSVLSHLPQTFTSSVDR